MFWSFAVKYWIVAKKLELFRSEIRIESKKNLFSCILFGGAAVIVVSSMIALIPEILLFYKIISDPLIAMLPTVLVCVLTLLLSVGFLIDGFIRMVKVLSEGECINRKLIAVISFAYFAEAFQFLVFIFQRHKTVDSITRSSYVVDIFFTIANATLATVLYQLGVDQE